MNGINKVILVGTLGRDPEVRHTRNDTAVATLSIATSEKWRDKGSGEQQEKTEWHRVVLWDRLAEIASEYLAKGSQVYIEGKLQTRKYEKDGVDHYATEIVGRELQMLGGRREQRGSSAERHGPDGAADAPPDFDDDIPF